MAVCFLQRSPLAFIQNVSFVVDLQKPLISQLFIAAEKKQSRPKEKQKKYEQEPQA